MEDYRAAIARGRQIKQIDRQIEKLQQRLTQQTSPADTSSSSFPSTSQEMPPQVPMLAGGAERSPKASLEQSSVELTNLTEQDRLVKEVLASSQALRASLRQSVALGKQLGARHTDLRKGHPRVQ